MKYITNKQACGCDVDSGPGSQRFILNQAWIQWAGIVESMSGCPPVLA
jgi:hypothetical protein